MEMQKLREKADSESETLLDALLYSSAHPRHLKSPFKEKSMSYIWPSVPEGVGPISDLATHQLCHFGQNHILSKSVSLLTQQRC